MPLTVYAPASFDDEKRDCAEEKRAAAAIAPILANHQQLLRVLMFAIPVQSIDQRTRLLPNASVTAYIVGLYGDCSRSADILQTWCGYRVDLRATIAFRRRRRSALLPFLGDISFKQASCAYRWQSHGISSTRWSRPSRLGERPAAWTASTSSSSRISGLVRGGNSLIDGSATGMT